MAHSAPARSAKPTVSPQLVHSRDNRTAVGKARRAAQSPVISGGTERTATRGDNRVVELGWGATVYPPREPGGRWRAVWREDGQRRQCQASSEGKLAVMLERVAERVTAADAPFLERPGAELIGFYLSPDRLPSDRQWSRKHAHTQARLCERFAAPVIALCAARTSRCPTCGASSTPLRRRVRAAGCGG